MLKSFYQWKTNFEGGTARIQFETETHDDLYFCEKFLFTKRLRELKQIFHDNPSSLLVSTFFTILLRR